MLVLVLRLLIVLGLAGFMTWYMHQRTMAKKVSRILKASGATFATSVPATLSDVQKAMMEIGVMRELLLPVIKDELHRPMEATLANFEEQMQALMHELALSDIARSVVREVSIYIRKQEPNS